MDPPLPPASIPASGLIATGLIALIVSLWASWTAYLSISLWYMKCVSASCITRNPKWRLSIRLWQTSKTMIISFFSWWLQRRSFCNIFIPQHVSRAQVIVIITVPIPINQCKLLLGNVMIATVIEKEFNLSLIISVCTLIIMLSLNSQQCDNTCLHPRWME